uniref:Uncharacterized protein n=1 Tax=Tanacetum cinerariifolium TaxID=118510 RepID=A0A6L2JT10_TANCI|nr:hypothetical protein [Tanacetum cinerariifolium]
MYKSGDVDGVSVTPSPPSPLIHPPTNAQVEFHSSFCHYCRRRTFVFAKKPSLASNLVCTSTSSPSGSLSKGFSVSMGVLADFPSVNLNFLKISATYLSWLINIPSFFCFTCRPKKNASSPIKLIYVVPPPYTGTFMPPKPDLVFHNAPNDAETVHTTFNVEIGPTKPDKYLSPTPRPLEPIKEDWIYDSKDDSEAKIPQNAPSFVQTTKQVKPLRPSVKPVETSIPAANPKTTIPKPTSHRNSKNRKACFMCKSLTHLIKDYDFYEKKMAQTTSRNHAKRGNHKQYAKMTLPNPQRHVGNPQHTLKDKGVINSGCSRHLTGNMSNLSDFEAINGGYVTFGRNPKGGKISGKGKFDGKVDEGFLVGYSVSSKAFRVFNSRTRIVQETLRINFLENKPHVAGSGPLWLFDIDTLIKTMNYQPVTIGNQSNPSAGVQEQFDAEKVEEETVQQYVLFPVCSAQSKKHDDKTKREDKGKNHVESLTGYRNLSAEFEDFSDNSTNKDNAASTLIPAVGQISTNSTNTFSAAGPSNAAASPTYEKSSYVDSSQLHDDLNMPELEDITYYDDEEDVGAEANFNNLETSVTVSPIPTTRVHKDHHATQIIGDLSSATQTRSMTRVAKDQGGRIDYEEVFALFARIEAIRLFLAYASFMGFMVYQMDVKSAFLYGTIKEEVYVYHPLGFEDPDHPDKRGKIDQTLFIKRQKGDILLVQIYVDDIIFGSTNKDSCKDFEKLMKDKFQMSLIKTMNDVPRLQALVDKKKVIITEATIRDALRLDDAKGIDCLPNEEIFNELARMGYVKPSTKLTFYKAFFSSQWKFLIHTILQYMSVKRTSWNEFSSSMASTIICLSTGRKFNFSKYIFDSLVRNVDSSTKFYMYPCFLQLMIRKQVGDLSSHSTKYSSPALIQKVFANMIRVGKGCLGVETPLFEGMIVAQQVGKGAAEVNVEDVPAAGVADKGAASVVDDAVPAAVEEPSIPSPTPPTPPPQPSQDQPSISQRVKKLEKRNKASKLRRLKKVGTAQRVETSDDTVMDDVSKQEWIIIDMDADKDVTLKDVVVVAKDVQDAEIKESLDVQERQAESQTQIYQNDLEHADKVLSMQDVDIEPAELQKVVEVVTTAKLITEVVTVASATITAAALQLTTIATPTLTTAPSTAKRRKGVDDVTNQVQRKEKEDNAVMRYQALKRKPQTKAQARKNMMIYLRNIAGFKIDYFKGMKYDDIHLIFEKYFNSNVAFLQKTKEQIEEEYSRALKRISESQEDKAAKKQKLDEEVTELKRHLQIVPNNKDDVYTEAIPLARKVPVVDYEIYIENKKPYYKIIRANGSPQLFLSFLSLLRNFNREDLEVLLELVKARFASSKPKNFLDDFLLTTLTYMFENPDVQAQMILLVKRRYPLTRFTLDQMLKNVKLEVEEESEVSLELLRFIRQQHQEGEDCLVILCINPLYVNTVSFGVDAAKDFKKNTTAGERLNAAKSS